LHAHRTYLIDLALRQRYPPSLSVNHRNTHQSVACQWCTTPNLRNTSVPQAFTHMHFTQGKEAAEFRAQLARIVVGAHLGRRLRTLGDDIIHQPLPLEIADLLLKLGYNPAGDARCV
jgi:hypothetical protein